MNYQKIQNQIDKGVSIRELSIKYNQPYSYFYQDLKRNGVCKKPLITKELLEKVYKKSSVEMISSLLGVKKGTVYYYIKKYSIPVKRTHHTTLGAKIKRMWEQTHDKKRISNLVGCSLATVYKYQKAIDDQDKGVNNASQQNISR